MLFQPLNRQEVIDVIDGRASAKRVPTNLHMWIHPDEFGDRTQAAHDILNRYPCDVQPVGMKWPDVFEAPADYPSYRWANIDDPYKDSATGIDERIAISDWPQLDGILADFPDPMYPRMTSHNPEPDGRYRLGAWWYCFFERHWSLRGMTNALMDYYTDPESVHRLYRALTDFYLVGIERCAREQKCDGILTSDDIGAQIAPFFSLDIFREFFKPYYKELIDKAHSLGMHFWLHVCGNIELFLPEFIELGLDVIHPIQKHTMDERHIAETYGKDICIWVGFDVQQTIPWGTVEEVRAEVRHLFDTYWRPDGRLMFTAGNGVNGDCPIPSLEALFDEAFTYGASKCRP